jgi:hypothetical protein
MGKKDNLFPYNVDGEGNHIGSSMKHEAAYEIARRLFSFHHTFETASFSGNSDACEQDIISLAWGLQSLFADGLAMQRLIREGESVRQSMGVVSNVYEEAIVAILQSSLAITIPDRRKTK